PDGHTLATGADDGQIRLWDVCSGRAQGELLGHTAAATALAFAPDGRTLVSGSRDGRLRLWDVPARQALATLDDHSGPVHAVTSREDAGRRATGADLARRVDAAVLCHRRRG